MLNIMLDLKVKHNNSKGDFKMKKRFEQMGNEMVSILGFENKMVIMYWMAFENKSWIVCEKIYKKFQSKRGK